MVLIDTILAMAETAALTGLGYAASRMLAGRGRNRR